MIKAVVDTNVLVSGLISPKGFPAKMIDFWRQGKFVLVSSRPILKELERVLNYPKIAKTYNLTQTKMNEYLKGFWVFAEICSPTKQVRIIKDDPEDNKFIEAASDAKVDFIVSGDKHLLNLGEYQRIKILTAKGFILSLKSEKI